MMRGIQKSCGHNKAMFLQPYASSYVSCQYVSAKPASNIQNLPRLPVPKLDDTLQKYLKTVKPHLNDDEFATTCNIIKDFAADGGVGRKLQSLLEKRAEGLLNWLEDWWLNTTYLEYRDPLVVFSNPGMVLPLRKFPTQQDQLNYAARTLVAALNYKSIIDSDKMPFDMIGNSQLDMQQYKHIFGTCRIPCNKRDKLSYNDSKYFTVMHNNHIFHMDLWGEDGVRLNEEQIAQQLKKVIELSQTRADNAIGILTSENRDAWAAAYQLLSKENVNRESLSDVEQSISVLCLDAPVGLWNHSAKNARQNLAGAQTLHGGGSAINGGNRWFDKTVQFVVGADGVTGLTYEHSPAEGQPVAVMMDFVVNYLDQTKNVENPPSASPIAPKKLNFVVSPEVAGLIKTAGNNLDKFPRDESMREKWSKVVPGKIVKTSLVCSKKFEVQDYDSTSRKILKSHARPFFQRLVGNLELNCFTFEKYGKNFIKMQNLSPDSYLQMAMQYAFYMLHKTPGAHYESAATRMYVGGRTETIRSCSVESVEFAKTMLDSKRSPKEKLTAMQKAIKAHKDYTVQALQGFGVDRHLLGLKLTAIENGMDIPELYKDPGFVRSAHMRISTSQVAIKCDGFMCFSPLVPNGYTTCYNPRENDVNFSTSAFISNPETSCEKYRSSLEQALQDMHGVLLSNTPSKL